MQVDASHHMTMLGHLGQAAALLPPTSSYLLFRQFVEVLLDDVAVLGEDAVGVAVAGEVINGEEDVIFELEGAFRCLAA